MEPVSPKPAHRPPTFIRVLLYIFQAGLLFAALVFVLPAIRSEVYRPKPTFFEVASFALPFFGAFVLLLFLRKWISWLESGIWLVAFAAYIALFFVWVDTWSPPQKYVENWNTPGMAQARQYKTLADYFELDQPFTICYPTEQGRPSTKMHNPRRDYQLVEVYLEADTDEHRLFKYMLYDTKLTINIVSDVVRYWIPSDGAGLMGPREAPEPGVAFIEQTVDGELLRAQIFEWTPDRVLLVFEGDIEALYDSAVPLYDILQLAPHLAP